MEDAARATLQNRMQEARHTPGPWPIKYTGDRKRIVIGDGLVEGPRGYEVAEVYSDDCPRELAEANARLISAAPDFYEAAKFLVRAMGGEEIDDEVIEGAFGEPMLDALNMIRAAIRRAELTPCS